MDLTCSEPPGHATHWTGRAMAKAVGVTWTTSAKAIFEKLDPIHVSSV
jgi:hypothetical protein